MRSTILQTATRYLFPIIMLFSFFLLLRGHDEPGGGFIGGLLGATAFALFAVAYDVPTARRMLRIDPHQLVGIGLLAAAVAGLISVLMGDPFLSSQWATVWVPTIGDLKLSTPLLFDIGVYLVVVGVTLMIVFALAEE